MDRNAPGWRLHEQEAARARISEAENGALVVEDVARDICSWPDSI